MTSQIEQAAIMDPSLLHTTQSASNHLLRNSAADQVLSINELLSLVFSFMSQGCNATNARVCKKWCDIALDRLWRKVTDITCLFNILGTLSDYNGYKKFNRLPEPQDWTRFENYGRRIRELFCQDDTSYSDSAFKSVFKVIGMYRTTFSLLPNLHTLHWIANNVQSVTKGSVLFMHDRVETFTLAIPPLAAKHNDLAPFFRTVVSRMPRLSHLTLKHHVLKDGMEDRLIELLHGLPHLKHITFPSCHLPSRIVEELSRMAHLVDIDIDDSDELAFEGEEGTEVFAPSLAEGAFSSLRSLSMRAHLGDAAQFMKSNFAPQTITKIHIASRSPTLETSFLVQVFLSVLAGTCHNLRDLDMNLLPSTTRIPDGTSARSVITFDALRGIFKPGLTSFAITHPYPLAVTLDNINDIASNCPLLVKFVLNSAPAVTIRDHELPLTALVPFARHCPNMKILGLFFGASTSTFLTAERDLEPFKKPIVLPVGISDLEEDISPATHFLFKICPLGCEIEASEKWPGEFGVRLRARSDVKKRLEKRQARWSQVQCTLPVLSRLRTQDREGTQVLEAKIKTMGEQLELAIKGQQRESGNYCACDRPSCPGDVGARMGGNVSCSPFTL